MTQGSNLISGQDGLVNEEETQICDQPMILKMDQIFQTQATS